MAFTSGQTLTTNKISLPRRGRGKLPAIEADMLGEPEATEGGRTKMNTEKLKGFPLMELTTFAQQQGFDPSQALAEGINILIERAARGASGPLLTTRLVEEGLAPNSDEARLLAMHLRSLGKRLKKTDDEMIEWARQLAA